MLKVDTNRDDLFNNNDNKEQELIYEYNNGEQTYEFVIPDVNSIKPDDNKSSKE